MAFTYNWMASLTVLVLSVLIIAIARFIVFQVPAFKRTLDLNKKENKIKWRNTRKYPHRIKSSQRISLVTNIVFFAAILPFFVTFDKQSVGKIALDVFLILMIYDFFYYLTHRFVFHGQGYFRRVHAVHHQARKPTSIDSLLLHPVEVFIGIALFFAVTAGLSLISGGPFNVATIVITTVIYTQINQINHVQIDLDYFPFRTVNWIANKHAVHHIDMHQGNYATITLCYDKLFGTLD